MGVEKEGKPRRKVVHFQSGVERRLDVGDGIGQRESHFLHGGAARFADVVARDADGIPTRYVLVAVAEEIGDQPHRRAGRKDVGSAGHVLFQNVILNRTLQNLRGHTLFFGHGNVHGQQHRGGRIDGHGGGDLSQGDPIE